VKDHIKSMKTGSDLRGIIIIIIIIATPVLIFQVKIDKFHKLQ